MHSVFSCLDAQIFVNLPQNCCNNVVILIILFIFGQNPDAPEAKHVFKYIFFHFLKKRSFNDLKKIETL